MSSGTRHSDSRGGGFLCVLILALFSQLLCAAGGIAAPQSTALDEHELRIRVLDRKDLGARVLIVLNLNGSPMFSAYTDWSGNVSFRGLVPGKYVLVIIVAEEEIYRRELILPEGRGVRNETLRLRNVEFSDETGKTSVNDLRTPAPAYKLYLEGLEAMRRGDLEEALVRLDDALTIYPAHSKSHNARGVALHMLGRNDQAEEAFRAAVRFDSTSLEPRFNLGKLLLDSNRPDEAKTQLQRAFELNKENVATAALLIESMLMMHEADAAVSIAKSLDRQGLKFPARIHLLIASELSKQGMAKLAAEQYSLALKDAPSLLEQREAEAALSLNPNRQKRHELGD